MTLSHGFRRLANVLETLEANGLNVLDVATTDEADERLTVDLTVTVPLDAGEPQPETTPSDDEPSENSESGPAQSEGSSAVVRERVLDPLSVRASATNGASPVETMAAEPADEGESVGSERPAESAESETGDAETTETDAVVDCPIGDCDATFENDHGMKIHRTKVHGDESDGTDDGAPAYRDPDRLREVYAACDSFTEMREALGTDVSTQTVRRQMIAHDIYEPGESGTGSRSTGEVEQSDGDVETDETDGGSPDVEREDGEAGDADVTDDESELDAIELPEGVTVADLKAGVASAQTLYDVQQRFDLGRDAAMQLLERYDLLELVHGRVSNRDRRKQVDEDEITRRILEHAPVARPSRA